MIYGYKALSERLGGRVKPNTLSVRSVRGTLGLSEHWERGHRTFDPVEVEAMLSDLLAKEAKRANRKIFNNTANGRKGQHHHE